MNINFITFATKNWKESQKRYEQQLKRIAEINFFKEYKFFTEEDLGNDYLERFSKYFSDHGFAYYSWKPYLILKELERIEENDFLIYFDGGCSFPMDQIDNFLSKLKKKCDEINSKNAYIGASIHRPQTPIQRVIRKEILSYFSLENENDFLERFPHYQAGMLILKKTKEAINLVKNWYQVFVEQYEDIIRSEYNDKTNQIKDFIHNVGDQAILLCLLYKKKIPVIDCTDPFLNFRSYTRIRR